MFFSMNKSANKTLITMKVNNKIQMGVAFTARKRRDAIKEERKRCRRQLILIQWVPGIPQPLLFLKIQQAKRQKKESKGHPTLKIIIKNSCIFPTDNSVTRSEFLYPISYGFSSLCSSEGDTLASSLITVSPSKSIIKEKGSSTPLSACFNKAKKISCPQSSS